MAEMTVNGSGNTIDFSASAAYRSPVAMETSDVDVVSVM